RGRTSSLANVAMASRNISSSSLSMVSAGRGDVVVEDIYVGRRIETVGARRVPCVLSGPRMVFPGRRATKSEMMIRLACRESGSIYGANGTFWASYEYERCKVPGI